MYCSIYKITNTINFKIYVGQTWKSIQHRFQEHCYPNDAIKISRAIQKHGKENFKIELITLCSTQEVADYWEIFWIQKLESNNRSCGYNIRGGGSRGRISEDTKKLISLAKTGKKLTEDHKRKISEIGKGRIVSVETRKKLSDSHLGKIFSVETKQKMSKSGKIKIFTKEHRINLAKSGTGRVHSEETKRKISNANKNEKSETHRKNISIAKSKRNPISNFMHQKLLNYIKDENSLDVRLKFPKNVEVDIYYKFHNENKSIPELIALFNCSKSTVLRILKRLSKI